LLIDIQSRDELAEKTINRDKTNIAGSRIMLHDTMVDPMAPKQPHAISMPRERSTALAIKKEILKSPIPTADRRVRIPKSNPIPNKNSIKGSAHPKPIAKGPGSISKSYTIAME
jgi:hypothetical protein